MFLENLLSFFAPKGDVLTVFWERQRMGWIAAADIAAVAARVLTEGPRKHHRQNYWMSTEALDGPELAAILSDVTGRDIKCDIQGADDFKALFQSSHIQVESWYAEGGVEFMRQVIDGRMGNISTVGMSPDYFARQFKKSIGQTPYEYVVEARVRKAKQLLTTGKFTISEVALNVGFADQSHLTRHFKRVFGLPPGRLFASRKARDCGLRGLRLPPRHYASSA